MIKVVIDGQNKTFESAVDYITELKDLLEEYQIKNENLFPKVNTQSVVIGSDKQIETQPKVNEISVKIESPKEEPIIPINSKLTSTFPKGNYPISSNNLEVEEPKKTSRRNQRKIVNYPKFKRLQSTRFVGQKIPDEKRLIVSDCGDLFDKPIVFVSGSTSRKSETNFIDNIELLSENIPNVPKAAFISGKATSGDKVSDEALKILRMCAGTINSGVLCYEINNEALREMESDHAVLQAFNAIEQMAGILQNEGYSPLICVELDARDKINEVLSRLEPEHIINYPVLSRISSRQLDDISENDDLIVMHPGNQYDQVILTDRTREYVQNAINKNIKSEASSLKAA